ncbi:MAG TPA: hypothetical protein VEV43_07625 [Actinomycetota bacterium]|nr:hypothetical protein [Actinomycetota bacterium]
MGSIRRHPFLTLIFVVGSLPVVFLLVVEAAQHTSACRRWRAEVDERSTIREPPAWVEYDRGDMPLDEYYGGVRDHVAHELREGRPLFCK